MFDDIIFDITYHNLQLFIINDSQFFSPVFFIQPGSMLTDVFEWINTVFDILVKSGKVYAS